MDADQLFYEIFPDSKPSMTVTLDNGYLGSTSWSVPENLNQILKRIYNSNMPKQFIQYTSLDGLFGIINSCQLRLYNLYNLNDPSELKSALNEFNFSLLGDTYKREKQYMFVTSFCGYDMDLQNEDYNMWRLYGKDGFGSALVFEIENYNSEWSRYFFGKVHYGKDNKSFNYLKKISEYYYNRNKNIGVSLPSFIPMMCMLYKHEVWKLENEFRLFINLWYNDKTFLENIPLCDYFLWTNLNHYVTDRGEKGAYTSIPFNLSTIQEEMKIRAKGHNTDEYFDKFPHLKLKQVIVGYNVNEIKTKQIVDIGSKLIQAKLGYQVDFIQSKFKDEFK